MFADSLPTTRCAETRPAPPVTPSLVPAVRPRTTWEASVARKYQESGGYPYQGPIFAPARSP
jgi:hypothetical protein